MDAKNGFEKHGIKHSSASQINMYAAAPCAWVAKYLYGREFNFSLAAESGKLVEAAIVDVLARGESVKDATDKAVAAYMSKCILVATERELDRGDGIPGMIEQALAALDVYGEPEFINDPFEGLKQKKIELLCRGDGWTLPVIGYLDFHYPQHGLVVDLKTTMRAPSAFSDAHLRQGAIYKQAMGNHAVKFLYVTPKKAVWHEVGDTAPVLGEIKTILTRQEHLLRLDADVIRSIVPVVQDSFYWNGDEAVRKEIYGI